MSRVDRNRRYHKRLEKGIQVAPVEYDQLVIDNLLSMRLLLPEDAGDVQKVAKALEKMARTVL